MKRKRRINRDVRFEFGTYPSAENLVDCCGLLEGAFRHHLGPHLFHIEHEGIQWFLYVWLLVLFLAVAIRGAILGLIAGAAATAFF